MLRLPGNAFVNVESLFDAFKLGSGLPGTHSGRNWFQCRFDKWTEWSKEFKLGDRACRQAPPINLAEGKVRKRQKLSEESYSLNFPSISMPLLLVQLLRGGAAKAKKFGRFDNEDVREVFKRIVKHTTSTLLPSSFEITLHVDPNASVCQDKPFGKLPVKLIVESGKIDSGPLMQALRGISNRVQARYLNELLNFAKQLDVVNNLFDFLVISSNACVESKAKPLVTSMFRQVLMIIAAKMDAKIHEDNKDVNHTSDPLYDPLNSYATGERLGRYMLASQLCSEGSLDISICGPDGTKIGTSLSIIMGAMMFDNGRACVTIPQVGAIIANSSTSYFHFTIRSYMNLSQQCGGGSGWICAKFIKQSTFLVVFWAGVFAPVSGLIVDFLVPFWGMPRRKSTIRKSTIRSSGDFSTKICLICAPENSQRMGSQ